jgi:hypothetical protein
MSSLSRFHTLQNQWLFNIANGVQLMIRDSEYKFFSEVLEGLVDFSIMQHAEEEEVCGVLRRG